MVYTQPEVMGKRRERNHIRRYHARRTNYTQWGCGCLLAGGFVALLAFILLYAIWPNLTGAAVQLAGATRLGETSSVFQNAAVPPTAVVQNATSPQQVTVNLGQTTVSIDPLAGDFVTGSSETGLPIARASFTEAQLMAICVQQSTICRDGNDQFRNPSIDLRPGGAVINTDVNISGLAWQRVGVVFQLDSTRTALHIVGIDINGGLYDYNTLPPDLAGRVDEINRMTNDVLRQLAVQTGGQSYILSEIIIDNTTLTIIFQ
jgi:hypothetical protein